MNNWKRIIIGWIFVGVLFLAHTSANAGLLVSDLASSADPVTPCKADETMNSSTGGIIVTLAGGILVTLTGIEIGIDMGNNCGLIVHD